MGSSRHIPGERPACWVPWLAQRPWRALVRPKGPRAPFFTRKGGINNNNKLVSWQGNRPFPRRLAVGGAPVGLKKRHAGSLQTEVEHVEVGDRGMKKPGAGVRGGVRRGGSLSCWTDRGERKRLIPRGRITRVAAGGAVCGESGRG